MVSSVTGLLLITQLRTVLSNCVDVLLKSVGPSVERKLYVALDRNLAAKFGKNNGAAFDFVADVYRAASALCQPSLDVRVLLENLKEDFLSKPINTSLYQRIYGEVDCIFVDTAGSPESNECVANILNDIQNAGVTRSPQIVQLDVPSSSDRSIPSAFLKENGCKWEPSVCKYSGVVLGGTFDRIHNGHKILLSMASLMAKDQLTCGITDGAMLEKKILHELISPVEDRVKCVSEFVSDVDSTLKQKIVPIIDPFGPSTVDTNLQCIVASKETIRGAFKVNEERLKKHLNELDVYVFDMVEDEIVDMCDEKEKKISSSKTRQYLLGEVLKPPKPNRNIDQVPYIIGLTGGIASGKSHIAKYLQTLGAFVIECDQLGHAAYSPGTPTYEKVVLTFGQDVVDVANGGVINRKVLAGKVFADPTALQTLNGIVWPDIIRAANELVIKARKDGFKVVVLDAAVLLEAGWEQYVHEVWMTIIPPEEAIKRIQERNKLTEDQARQRVKAQPKSNKERVSHANVVFCSLWDYPVTQGQVKKAWDNLIIRLNRMEK